MTDSAFEVEDHVTFAGGEGEFTRIFSDRISTLRNAWNPINSALTKEWT